MIFSFVLGKLIDWAKGAWVWLAAIGAVVLAVLAALARARADGKTAARAEGMKEQLENVETRTKVDENVSGDSDSTVRDELRDRYTREP